MTTDHETEGSGVKIEPSGRQNNVLNVCSFTKRQGKYLEILDIVESVYQWYFHVKDINSAFEYCLGRWNLNERKTLCNIPKTPK